MSQLNRDPAYRLFVDDCAATVGARLQRTNVERALTLLEEENTVPFIARYRRDQTGDIEVSDLYELQRRWHDFTAMVKLRSSRLATLEAAGRCDDEIRLALQECVSKEELDELYATVKETKTAKSEIIKSFCVDSIAADMLAGTLKFAAVPQTAMEAARSTKYSVLEAVAYHCTSLIASELDVKDCAKNQFSRHPTIVVTSLTTAYKALAKSMSDSKNGSSKAESGGQAKTAKATKGEPEAKVSELMKYKDYHSVNRRLNQLAAHQLLAIRRGKEAGVISITLSPDDIAKQNILRFIHSKYRCFPPKEHAGNSSHGSAGSKIYTDDVLQTACKEVLTKLCASLTKKQWKDAITSAEVEAAVVFGTSLRPLLLTAPLREVISQHSHRDALTTSTSATPHVTVPTDPPVVVLAVDPGFAHGHKWVVLSQGAQSGAMSSGVPAQGEATSILCYGKIFEKSHGSTSKDTQSSSGSAVFKNSPVILHSAAQLGELLNRFRVQVVAIGNGTGSREAQQLVATAMENVGDSVGTTALSSAPTSGHGTEAATVRESHKRKRADEATAGPTSTNRPAGHCMGYVVVSEAGASVYSASKRAREEFPPAVLDISYVGAVSIGRRLIDPLSELVKIQVSTQFLLLLRISVRALGQYLINGSCYRCQPSSLGVGMYQHDLSDKGIAERLRNVVEDCVNVVGVDVNTASADLLRYVSGLNESNVKEIIAHRTVDASAAATSTSTSNTTFTAKSKTSAASGRISSLAELRGVKGIGPKTFRNCAGFLRVYSGPEPLDCTNIHPEDYELARAMIKIFAREHKTKANREAVSGGDKKHKKAKKEAVVTEETAQLVDVPQSASFWMQYQAGHTEAEASASKGTTKEAALLQAKSPAELEQIWAWVLESGVLRSIEPSLAADLTTSGSHNAAVGGTKAGQPYMSFPKVLHEIPRDFHASVSVGSVIKGVIRNVTTFGAFVDLGGVVIGSTESAGKQPAVGKGKASCDGLLHCSKYRDFANKSAGSGGTQRTPAAMSAEIYVGREVMVKILAIEETEGHKPAAGGHDKRRISLDLVELL